jgi:D-amino-acid oxidase
VSPQALKAPSARAPSAVAAWEQSRRELHHQRKARHTVRVAILGGGIAGLSAAHELQLCGVNDITIYEDQPIERTASFVAAGLIEPVAGSADPAGGRLETELFASSMPAWASMHERMPSFVAMREVDTYCAARRAPLPWADQVYGFRALHADELHPAYRDGEAARFSTYVVETPRFLAARRARLVWTGAQLVRRHIDDLAEIGDVDAIVNASGLGAATLAHDRTMFRGDGHVISVRPLAGVERVFMDESRAPADVERDPLGVNMLYIIPRAFDIVIGGTLWDHPDTGAIPRPIASMPGHLLALAARVEPRLTHAAICGYQVAARPRRQAGVRAELDLSRHVPVVHCYGQGGSGWTLAPALAETAIGLLASAAWADTATG